MSHRDLSTESESSGSRPSRAERLHHILEHAAHLLPAQGPIGVFIHHNTLHAFQHLPFDEAVVEAAKLYGTEPYMTEEAYRLEVGRGRIQIDDIDAVLSAEPDVGVWDRRGGPKLRRRELRRRLLVPGLRRFDPETIIWDLEDGGLVDSADGDSKTNRRLFSVCLANTPVETVAEKAAPARPRDAFRASGGPDLDDIVNPWVIRSAAAYTDQGIAYWPMPNRGDGFLEAVRTLISQPLAFRVAELQTLPSRSVRMGKSAEEVIANSLDELGVPESEWEQFIIAELLALPGWAGIMSRLELEPELAPHERVPAKLIDYLAVRMLLTLAAVDSLTRFPKSWRTLPVVGDQSAAVKQRLANAAAFFDAALQLGFTASELEDPAAGDIGRLREEIFAFHETERRRIFHGAYERRHERQILLPLAEHLRRPPVAPTDRLAAQVFFCLDEREESIRRHLEEVSPEVETFGAAGFYGAAINYTGIDDAHGVSLCPVVVKPAHAVRERPSSGQQGTYESRTRLRKLWATMTREWWVSSRTLVRGWLGTTVLGVFSIVPMAARVFSPRHYALLIEWLNSSVLPEPRTELAFERSDAQGHAAAEGLMQGFTVDEKVDRVAGLLGPAGLTKGMARMVVTLGHGSTSLNNPHESAHDCGACGGRRGGPNGRLFAAMANHPEVRKRLRERNILIPEDTWFVGGYHDTCNDNVDLYDLDLVPESHRADLGHVRAALDKARARSSHERARRFEAADYSLSAEGGLHHVQERAEHLAEPRPEYGHCTNAVTIVGRRSSTRGLFMDRRAFLLSYDPLQDPENENLGRLLGAALPVCAGINLEYYFSFVDNEGYGCGTKLPHNVTGLVGVMNGYESDLRTGLPWQMVEIHEPVRSLFVIEGKPERVLETFRKNALNWEFLNNRWIRLAVQDPITGEMQMYRQTPYGSAWEAVTGDDEPLRTARSSREWYQNKREHLPLARIESRAMSK